MLACSVTKRFQGLESVLLDLGMRIAEGYGKEGGDGGSGVGSEGGKLCDGGGRETADFCGWKAEQWDQLGQDGRVGATAQGQGTLDGLVVEVLIHKRSGVGERE